MSERRRLALAAHFEAEADAATAAIAKLAAERAMLLSAAQDLRRGPQRKPGRRDGGH